MSLISVTDTFAPLDGDEIPSKKNFNISVREIGNGFIVRFDDYNYYSDQERYVATAEEVDVAVSVLLGDALGIE